MDKQLPKNWVECSLGEIIKTKKGKKPNSTIDYPKEGYVPYILIDEMEGKPIRSYTNDPNVSIVSEDEVLLVWDGSIGKCGSGINGAIGSTLVALKPLSNIPTRFIEYTLINKNSFIKQTSTGTGLQHINKDFFKNCFIGLPPISEQIRIVAKLDALFAQMETIKSSMATVPLLLKDFREQVLTQAVTGKLLKINQFTELGNLEIEIKTGPFGSALHKSDYIENGIPVINPSHIHNGLIIPDYEVTISTEIFNKLKVYKLFDNDVILGRRGEMGRAALYNKEYGDCICGTGSIILRCGSNLYPKFLTYYLRSPFCVEYLNANSVGSTMINLNQKIIKSLRVPNISYSEQQEIVSRVESLFAKADAIEKQYESLKAKIDHLPQALLHKAFKGELIEQLDSDGDARELLREIQALKATSGKGGKKVGKTVKHYNEKEVVLDKVAEPDNTNTFTEIMNQLNFDYEIAAIVSLTFGRFQRSYGKKYIHKMFSNIELLNTLPVFTELTFEENGWGMFSPQIKKAIEEQKFIQFEEINDNQQVLQLNFKYFKEVSAWMKEEENKEFISQVNEMLTIYENPIINKKMDNIELFNTVLECMKVLKTDNFQAIYEKMKNWPMKEEGFETKADKFKELETQSMIDFIKEIKN